MANGNKLSQIISLNLDLSQSKQQFKYLKQQMDAITGPRGFAYNLSQGITSEIMESTKYATLLRTQLAQATNPLTGNLNLTKFNDQLRLSGTNLLDYQKQLSALGTAGNQAFNSLASSIASAETPLLRTSQAAQQMWTALGNTVRWQATSSLVHGVMSTAASAMNYVKNLDSSLNDIRIVTGQTQEQMTRFATQANQAAKALNTTTNNYARAALIYYQQGLSNKQVEERTEATIKLANVSGQSAKKVSDQMTAVWNNFYDGSKSLEYYADVITALGASTASSSEEIAKGLSKFSSIAQTTGLSYEYATSALSTVVAATRQSADAVGTTFKTLFSRLQGLKLGETLDDGVTLNKYSKALDTIGINILNANGSLKSMDNILDELGTKWQSLTQAQQVALSQTIGGVRSYTGLVSLMDNWDSFQKNLQTAQNAQGTLNAQAQIYSESWEAASAHVRAASETIYSNLLSDKFFKGLTNGFGTLLDGVGAFTTGLGGVSGTLLQLGGIASRVFNNQIAAGIDNTALNLRSIFYGEQDVINIKEQASKALLEDVTFSRYGNVNALQKSYNEALNNRQLTYDSLIKNNKVASYMQPVYQAMFNALDSQTQDVIREAEQYYDTASIAEFSSIKLRQTAQYNADTYLKQQRTDVLNDLTGAYNGSSIRAEAALNNYINAKDKQTAGEQLTKNEKNIISRTEGLFGNKGDATALTRYYDTYSKYGYQGTSDTGAGNLMNQQLGKYGETYRNTLMASELKVLTGSTLNPMGMTISKEDAARTANYITSTVAGFKQLGYNLDGSLKPLTSLNDEILKYNDQLMNGTINQIQFNEKIQSLIETSMGSDTGLGKFIDKYTSNGSYENSYDAIRKEMINDLLGTSGENGTVSEKDRKAAEDLVDEALKGTEKEAKAGLKLAGNIGKADESVKNMRKNLEALMNEKTVVSFGQGMTTIAGAAASIGSSLVSAVNTWKVFGDETATAQQKTQAIVSTLGTLPMTFANITNLAGKWGNQIAGLGMTVGALSTGIMGAAAGLGVLAIGIDQAKQSTEATALKNFTTAVSTAAQKTAEAAQKNEQLSILEDSHNQLLSALNNSQVGTLENTRALLQANQVATNMIDQYNLQYGEHYTYGQNGEIIFDAAKMEKVQEDAEQAALNAMYDESYIRATNTLLDTRDNRENEALNQDVKKYLNEEFTYEVQRGKKSEIQSSTLKEELDQYTRYISNYGDSSTALSFKEYAGQQVVEAIGKVLGKSSTEVEQLVEKSLKGLSPGQETITDNSFLNELLSEADSQNKLKTIAAAEELLNTAGQQLKATGLQTDLATAYLSSDKDALIQRQTDLAIIASKAAQDTFLEKLFTKAGVNTSKQYYEALGLGSTKGLSEDEIKEGILAKIVSTVNTTGTKGLQELINDNDLYKELVGNLQIEGIQDVITATERLGISNLNNFKGLKVSDINKELGTLQDKIKEYEKYLKTAPEEKRQQLEQDISLMKSYNEAIQNQTNTMIQNVVESFGQNLSQDILGKGQAAWDAYTALSEKYALNELQSIAGYVTQGNVFYGQHTADAIYNAFLENKGSVAFEAMNKIDWNTSLSSLADLSKYAKKAGEATNIFSDILNKAIEDVGGSGGIFQQLYNSSGFSKVLDKLESVYTANGRITGLDITKYAEKSEELANYLQIGENTGLQLTSGGLAGVLNAINNGDIRSDEVTTDLVNALSIANQRETIEAEAFEYYDNQDLGRSGSELVKYFQNFGKAYYTAKQSNLTMDDPLMAVMNFMPNYIKDKYFEGLENGALKTFNDIMKDPELKEFTSFMSTLAGKKGKGGGTMADIITWYGQQLGNYDLYSYDENGNQINLGNARKWLVEQGLDLDLNNMNFLTAGNLTTQGAVNTLSQALGAMMSEESAKALATILVENASNTSAGMYLAKNDTTAAIQELQESANKGQTFSNGDIGGQHFYNLSELTAFYNQRKQYLDSSLYGESPSLQSFIQNILNGNAQLLAQNQEVFKNGINLGDSTLQAIFNSNKDLATTYGTYNEQTFKDISSLLYTYGAITQTENGNKYLDANKFTDFIVASGGTAEAANQILAGLGENGNISKWATENRFSIGNFGLGTTFTDKMGKEWSAVQMEGETYQEFIDRAAGLEKGMTSDKFWVVDPDNKNGYGGYYESDEGGYIRKKLLEDGWTVNADGSWSKNGQSGLIEGDLGTSGTTATGGGTTTSSGSNSEEGGTTEGTTPTTTTSTYTGSTPPSGKYSNWSTEAEQNAALTEFGGYEAASAKAKEAGFNGDMRGIMDYYAYTHPGELSNWELTADQIAFAEKTAQKATAKQQADQMAAEMAAEDAKLAEFLTREEAKRQAAEMRARAEATASAGITQSAANKQAAEMRARAEATASAGITQSAANRALKIKAEAKAEALRKQQEAEAKARDEAFLKEQRIEDLIANGYTQEEATKIANGEWTEAEVETARIQAQIEADAATATKTAKEAETQNFVDQVNSLMAEGYTQNIAEEIALGNITKEQADQDIAFAKAVGEARERDKGFDEAGAGLTSEQQAARQEKLAAIKDFAEQYDISEDLAREYFEKGGDYATAAGLRDQDVAKMRADQAAEEKAARQAEEEAARQAELEAAHEQTAKEFADYNDIDIEAARAALEANGWEWSAAQGTLPPPENNLENEEPVVIQPESVVVEQPPEEQAIQPEVSELTATDRLQALGWTDEQIGLFPGSPEDAYDLVMGLNGGELNEQAYSDLRSQFSEQDLENYIDQFGLETGDWVGLQAALNKVQNSLDEQTEALQNVDENTEQVADAYENENGTTMSEEERQNQEEEKTEDETFKDTNLPEREPAPATSPTSDFTNTSEGGGTDTGGGGAADTGGGGGGTTGGATDNDVAVSANNASGSWGEAVAAIGGAIGAIADAVGSIFGKATGQNNTRILQFASGKEGHMAVTGELGPELTIRGDGSVDMLGQHGREYAWVNPDDIIYTAAQTASIMGNNNIKWLNGFAKGFNNKIRGYDGGYTGEGWTPSYSSSDIVANTDNPGGVNSGGVGEAVRRGAYSGTYGGMMAAQEEVEEQDPRYDLNTLKERDILTRYFTILQQLDDITREVEHFGKAADRAWGEEKIQAIDRQTEAYKEQFSYYQKYMGQIENYLKSDQDALTLMIKEFARDFKEKTGVEIFGGSTSQSQQRQNPDEGSQHVYGLTQYGGNPTPSRAIGQNNNIIAFADGTSEQEEKKRLEQQLEENRARRTEQMSMSNSFYKEQQIDLMAGMMPQDTFVQQDTSGQDAALLRDPINWVSAEYDLNGVLTNYQEIVERMIQVYNENAEAFAQDKEAQYKFQEMLKDIQFYTDSLNLYESQKEVLNDLKNAILDNQIRRIVYQISYENELDNNALKEINYNFEKIRDNAYRSADAIDYYATKMEYLDKSNERYKEGIKDILATYSGNVTNGIQNQIMLSFYRKAPMKGYDIPDQETPGLDQLEMRYDEFGMPIQGGSESFNNPMDGIRNFYKDIYTENYETTRGAVETATVQVVSNIGKNTAGIIQQQSNVATETIAKVAENTANDIGRATFSEINRIDDTITGVNSYFNSKSWMEDYRYDFMNGVFSSNKEEEKEEENTSTLVTKNGVTTDTAKRKRYKGTPPNKDSITPPRQMDYLDGTFSGRRFMNSNLVYGEGMFGPENSPTLMGQPVDEYTELPYFPTDQEVEEYFKNFTAVQIGEETYYVPKSADIEIRDDMVQPIDITRAIVNNKGQLTKDEKDLITAQVKAWYDELTKVAPELAANIKPIYQDGFMTNFREVLNAINDANAQMSDYMYDLLINDTEEFFKRWSEITVNNADFQDITTETATQLENMIDIIYANLQQKEKYIDTIISTLGNDIKTFNKELNAQIDEFDFYNEILSNYESIINLTNKRSTNIGNSFMSNLRDALLDNAINKISGTKTTYDTMRQMYNGAKETYDLAKEEFENYRNELLKNMTAEEAAQDQHYQYLEDRLDQVQDEMDIANSKLEDSNKQFLKAWEDALSKIQSDYTEAVQDAARTLEESFSPLFNTFDLLQAEFERQKNLEDYYLDDYQRIHDLNALDRSIEQSILDTDNLKSKARLRDMQKEINDLMDEGTELSAYDLDILQKKYDIELARQALEDAKEAKSVVRLSRDNNGNWSYVYTSDDQEIEEAEQNYENTIRDMEEANENYIDNLEAQIIQVQQAAEQAILNLSPEDFATYDEYLTAVAAIQQNMYTTLDYLREQLNHAFGNNEWLDPIIVNRYGKNDHNLTDGWDKMTLAAVSGINSLDDAVGIAKDNLQDMIGSSLEAFEEYSKKQSEVYATAGADIKQASEYFNLHVNETLEESNQRVETTENLANRVGDAFAKTAEKVRDFNKDIFDLTAEYEKLNSVMIKFLEISGEYVPEEKLDFVTAVDTYKEIDEIKQVLGKYGKILVTDYDEKGNRRIYNLEENTETTAKQFEEWYELAAKNDEFDVGDDLDERKEYEKINNYLEEHGQVYVSIDGELKKLSKNNEEDMAWLKEKLDAIEKEEDLLNRQSMVEDPFGMGLSGAYPDYMGNAEIYDSSFGREERTVNINWNENEYQSSRNIDQLRNAFEGVYGDTGLYTGEWSGGSEHNNGRLAWLHQKELVLNEQDTENFLNAINIVRQLDNLTSWMANGLGDLFTPNIKTGENVLEQNVHIDASFPNVSDHNEIEEAFGNLVNLASQYANRKSFT